MSLRVFSHHFLVLCNHTEMVVPRAFHSCWKLLAFDQIQLDACYTVVWRQFEATFKLRLVIPIFERKEMTDCPRKPQRPTSIRIPWHIPPFSTQSARSVSYRLFSRSCASSWFSSQGTVNSMRRTIFCESDHATMSGHFSVCIMWTGNCRDVFRAAETFQSLVPFSSFILGFFCFPTGHSPSLRNWIMSSVAVIGCWFAVSHYVAMCTSEAIVDMQIVHGARYPDRFYMMSTGPNRYISHNFKLVAFGKRSYVDYN